MKLRLRFLPRQLDDIHLIQLLLPRHGHVPGGNPGLVARYKVFQLRDLLLLTLISCLQLRLLHSVDLHKLIVVSHIAVQTLVFHMVDNIHHTVQKWNIVGY